MSSSHQTSASSSRESSSAATDMVQVIRRTWGELNEGLTVNEQDPARRPELDQQYVRRRELAQLSRFPEGYEFQNTADDRPTINVILLSPPELVAVQRADGTWYRRVRNEQQDGPAPYSTLWYRNYLQEHELPPWFLQQEHVELLQDDAEAQMLGTTNVLLNIRLPEADYLAARYPGEPQYPTPDVFNDGHAYSYDLDTSELLKVARRFPATNVPGRNYRIFVCPSGHIVVRDDSMRAPNHLIRAGAMPWLTESAQNRTSSYVLEGARNAPVPSTSQSIENTTPERSGWIARAVDEGLFVNLPARPAGLGVWEFLDDADRQRAYTLGFGTPEAITDARAEGLLAQGMGINAGPVVVWTPDRRFLNPWTQPNGQGRWEYHTQDSRELAHINFGGNADTGFADNRRPSAADIWRPRQAFQQRIARGEDVEDTTYEVDLVWLPVGTLLPDWVDDDVMNITIDDDSDSDAEVETGQNIGEVDRHSGLTHEPFNRDNIDQTGPHGRAQYQTRLLPANSAAARKITVDRSRCHAPVPESWKGYLCNGKGEWFKYQQLDTLDWKDKAQVGKLNKWREQQYSRYGWAKKRTDRRVDYTEEQKKWLFDLVKAANGKRCTPEELRALTNNCNGRFPPPAGQRPRDTNGIQSAFDRLRKMFAEHGEYKKGRKRGDNVKERKAEAEREEREAMRKSEQQPASGEDADEEEEQPSRKRSKGDEGDGGDGDDGPDEDEA